MTDENVEVHHYIPIEQAAKRIDTTPETIYCLIEEKKLQPCTFKNVLMVSEFDLDHLNPDDYEGFKLVR